MKTFSLFLLLALGAHLRAQIPVTDVANLVNNQLSEVENIAKWVESIAQLRQQITQLDQQIKLQTDLRQWTGDPKAAGAKLLLESLGASDLMKSYGRPRDAVLSAVNSLDSLSHTARGSFRVIPSIDLDGHELKRDALLYRRYAVLDATQANSDEVTLSTKTREEQLQEEIAATLEGVKSAETEAEAQKLSAKLIALNGQLTQVETSRRREVDAVSLQKIANDARLEQERQAAEELAAKNDFLALQRVSTYMHTLKLRQHDNP